MEYLIEHLARHGITEIMVNVAWHHQKIEEYFGDGRRWDVQIGYSYEGVRDHGDILPRSMGSAGGMRRSVRKACSSKACYKARWRQASAAPTHSANAENTKPWANPPGPSAIQPTMVGPTICPNANTMVNALMPAPHAAGGRLCRTSAVVEATSDKNTAPNSRPEASTTGQAEVSAGSTVARPSKAHSSANT